MTPAEIETGARRKLNAVSSTFWSSEEIMGYIYEGCLELFAEAMNIERTYTTPSVDGQQEYPFPTNTGAIKRVTYNDEPLSPMTFREDDLIRLGNSTSISTGTPTHYAIWNETLYLRPIPSADGVTIKLFSYNEPAAVTSSSTLEVPTLFHKGLEDFVAMKMKEKEQDWDAVTNYGNAWAKTLKRAKAWQAKKKRGDKPAHVRDEG